jgi:hypothetical protein
MLTIRDIVKEAIAIGYLTLEAEDQLRQLLTRKYEMEDFKAFMKLQYAAMDGIVKQQSRELIQV